MKEAFDFLLVAATQLRRQLEENDTERALGTAHALEMSIRLHCSAPPDQGEIKDAFQEGQTVLINGLPAKVRSRTTHKAMRLIRVNGQIKRSDKRLDIPSLYIDLEPGY